MATTADLDAEIVKIEGKYLDLDGAPRAAPYQCHDLWLWLLYLVGGQPGEGYAPDDDTVSVFYQFPYRPRLAQLFTKHDGVAGIRKGDVLFWRRGVWYPGSHTAVALGPVQGELVPCLTQNPGPVRRANLITRDLAGYLRPRAFAGLTEGDDDMTPEQANQLSATYQALFGPANAGGAQVSWANVDGTVQTAQYGVLPIVIHNQNLIAALAGQVAGIAKAVSQIGGGGQIDMTAITKAAEKGAKDALAGLTLKAEAKG